MPTLHQLLDYARLDEIRRLSHDRAADAAQLRCALGDLLAHRRQVLTRIDGFRFPGGRPVRLSTFRARDPAETSLFVVAGDDGALLLGRSDDLDGASRADDTLPDGWVLRRLDDFNAGTDEIVTLAITRRYRLAGTHLDVWVVSRRWTNPSQPEWRCHHALAGFDGSTLIFEPARDDGAATDGHRIAALPLGEHFPIWLVAEHFVVAVGCDPFDEAVIPKPLASGSPPPIGPSPPASSADTESSAAPVKRARVTHTAWSPRRTVRADAHGQVRAYGAGATITDDDGDGHGDGAIVTFDVGAPARGIALAEVDPWPGFGALVVGTEDSALIAYRLADDRATLQWQQRMADPPTALAWLPERPSARPGDRRDGPRGLLVASRGGMVERLRRVDASQIDEVWSRLSKALLPQGPSQLFRRARELVRAAGEDIAQKRALLVAFAERLVEGPRAILDSATSDRDIARLLRADPSADVPLPALEYIIETVAARPASEGLSSLLLEVYEGSPLAVRERLDTRLRDHRGSGDGPIAEPAWQALMAHTRLGRSDLLNNPETPPEIKAIITIEGWANHFVEAETFSIPYGRPSRHHRDIPPLARLAISPAADKNDSSWVAIGQPTRIGLHPVTRETGDAKGVHLDSQVACKWPAANDQQDDRLVDLSAGLYDNRRCVIAAWRSGLIEVIEPVQSSDTWSWQQVDSWLAGARPVSIEAIDDQLVIGLRAGRVCRVAVWPLRSQATITVHDLPDQPRLSLIRIAHRIVDGNPSGLWLFAASTTGVAPTLHALGADGALGVATRLRRLRAPVTAAAFDDRRQPATLAVATRDGIVCGDRLADLKALEVPPAPRWLYQTIGAPRALAGLPGDEIADGGRLTRFLVATTHGRLTALDADTGARQWAHRLGIGLRHLSSAPSRDGAPFVVLSRDDGRVTVLERTGDRSFAKVKASLLSLDLKRSVEKPVLDASDRRTVEVLHAIVTASEPVGVLGALIGGLAENRYREARGRIVRYIACEWQGDIPAEHRQRLCEQMNWREHRLLLTLLPPAQRLVWLNLMRRRLFDDPPRAPATDDGVGAHRAALATWLNCGGLAGCATRNLAWRDRAFDALPPADCFDRRWVAFEVARHLIRTVTEATHRTEVQLSLLLEALTRGPLGLVDDIVALLPALHPLGAPLRALTVLIDNVRDEADSSGLKAAGQLSELLARLRADHGDAPISATARLFAWLGELHHLLSPGDGSGFDREPVYSALRRIKRLLTAPLPDRLALLVTTLDRLVPADPPSGQASFNARRAWLDRLRRSIALIRPPKGGVPGWEAFNNSLLRWTRTRLKTLADREDELLRELVRPRLTERRLSIDAYGRVTLAVAVEGEGDLVLTDARLTLRADDHKSGLLGVHPSLVVERDFADYPTASTRFEHEFSGTLPAGRRRVEIVATLSGRIKDSDRDKVVTERWSFTLPTADGTTPQALLPNQLPRTFDGLIAWLTRSSAPPRQLLLTTPALSGLPAQPRQPADAFARALVGQHGAHWLDLDHDERALDGHRPGDLNVITADRWLAHQHLTATPGAADAWVESLVTLTAGPPAPRLIWVLAAEHADALRLHRPDAFAAFSMIEAWRLDRHAPHAAAFDSAARAEQAAWQQARWVKGKLPEEALRTDLRLFLDGCDARFSASGAPAAGVAHRHPPIHLAVINALRALPPSQRLAAQALARSQVEIDAARGDLRAGMILARAAEWITGGHPKRQAPGYRLNDSDLRALQTAGVTVRVEGFAPGSGLFGLRSNLPALLAALPARDEAAPSSTLGPLVAAGLATRSGRICWLRSPYREVIGVLYDKHADPPEFDRDQRVYEALHGAGHSLIECVALPTLRALAAPHPETLLPRVPAAQRDALIALVQVVSDATPIDRIATLLGRLFDAPVTLLPPAPDAVDAPLRALAGLTLIGLDAPLADGAWATYLGWLDAQQPPAPIVRALAETARSIGARNTGNRRQPALFLIGPGAERMPDDPQRRFASLRAADLRRACADGDLGASLRQQARARMRHTLFSPFKVAGALPPGSPLFVGRTAEFDEIRATLATQSCLIVGARRIGKTSFLNRVWHWLESARPGEDGQRLTPIFLDCATLPSGTRFAKQLAFETRHTVAPAGTDDPMLMVQHVVEQHRARGELPVFLLNEIDALYGDDEPFIAWLRSLDERGAARFVCVAYASVLHARRVRSPLFNFTRGRHFGGRATYLSALSPAAAGELLGLLEAPPLSLRWRSPAERQLGHRRLIEQSYCIPWVLQHLADALVKRLEQQGRDVISDDDVSHVLRKAGPLVWRYFNEIDFKSLGFDNATDAHTPGMKLVLYAVARDRYFLGDAPIRRRDLAQRASSTLSFTVGDARRIVDGAIGTLLLGEQRARVQHWFRRVDLAEALTLLTLTLALEPDPDPDKSDRYGFLLHALPIELDRIFGRDDPMLDGLIIDTALEFLKNLLEET